MEMFETKKLLILIGLNNKFLKFVKMGNSLPIVYTFQSQKIRKDKLE